MAVLEMVEVYTKELHTPLVGDIAALRWCWASWALEDIRTLSRIEVQL
jgi:hypothetical protein